MNFVIHRLRPTLTKEGTGLGLNLSKSIVEAHGGSKIWAENNKDGRGATFSFDLPLIKTPAIPFLQVNQQPSIQDHYRNYLARRNTVCREKVRTSTGNSNSI
jgi:Histidine kinase-, DNA gyrase B-, and HSP90-like ATPase